MKSPSPCIWLILLALCLFLTCPAAHEAWAQDQSGDAGAPDSPSYLGPKPKPVRRTTMESSATAAPVGEAQPVKSKKAKKSRQAKAQVRAQGQAAPPAPAPPSASPRLVSKPKPKAASPGRARVSPAPKPSPRPSAPVVRQAPSARAVQQALARAGYGTPQDGKMDKATRQALKRYQRARGLKATGQADPATLGKLGFR